MKEIFILLAIFLSGCVPTDHPQIFPNPNIGNDLSMPRRSAYGITFFQAEKNDFFIEGRNVEDIPTIMFGVKF